jgi:hypothetical protein
VKNFLGVGDFTSEFFYGSSGCFMEKSFELENGGLDRIEAMALGWKI